MLILDRLRNKKGLSNLVAYVLLISISISLSVLVYGWLKFFVGGAEVVNCPSNVNIIIESYECSGGVLNISVKNKGLFDVDGYILRVHDRVDAEFGIYVFNEFGVFLSPGDRFSESYVIADYSDVDTVTVVDVQPFVDIDGKNVSCSSYSSQKVVCG